MKGADQQFATKTLKPTLGEFAHSTRIGLSMGSYMPACSLFSDSCVKGDSTT